MQCTYSLWEIALTHSFLAGAGFAIIFYGIKLLFKDENGKVARDEKGRFKSVK